jgi:hypothetical protein
VRTVACDDLVLLDCRRSGVGEAEDGIEDGTEDDSSLDDEVRYQVNVGPIGSMVTDPRKRDGRVICIVDGREARLRYGAGVLGK